MKTFRTIIFGICCFLLGYAAANYFEPESVIGYINGLTMQSEVASNKTQPNTRPSYQGRVLTLQIERDSKSTSESVAENSAENTAENAAEVAAKNSTESAAENIAVSSSENTPENVTEKISENVPEKSPEKISENVQEKVTEKAPEKTPEKVSKNTDPARQTPQNTAEGASRTDTQAAPPVAKVSSESDDSEIIPKKRARPKQPGAPKLALVINDMGYSYGIAEKILRIDLPVTWAIVPEARQSSSTANLAVRYDQPFLLHVPMQSIGDARGSSRYVIGVDTPETKIAEYLAAIQERFPDAIGVSNHRGAKATTDLETMQRFMSAYVSTGWGFLDSRTDAKTIAGKVAADYDIPVVENAVFIDEKPDLATMKKKFSVALRTAEEQGSAVAICHAKESILPFLKYLSEEEELVPVAFVTVDELLDEQKTFIQGGKK